MKLMSLKGSLCLVLAGMMTIGSPLIAGNPVEVRSTDYTLNEGLLTGSVLNSAAQPVSGLNVQLLHGDTVVATAVSDENGQFAVRGLRNGNHILQVGAVQQPVRFWSNQAAPPSSNSRMAIVVDEHVVRGQQSMGGYLIPVGLFGAALAATLVTTLGADDPTTVPASP